MRAAVWFKVALVTGLISGCLPRDEELGRPKKVASAEPARSSSRTASTSAASTKPAAKGSSAAARGSVPEVNASKDEPLTAAFLDSFERTTLGKHWRTGATHAWQIKDGQLCVRGARNQPLWLSKRFGANAQIEFDAVSHAPDGDIKVELWGDGQSGATGTSYTNATSYLAILGGWKNRFNVLARLDEHGKDRKELKLLEESEDPRAKRVVQGQTYRFKIERRDGKTLRWLVDDIEIHSFEDAEPLQGPGHDHFGFNNWDAEVCFDNLQIHPLGE